MTQFVDPGTEIQLGEFGYSVSKYVVSKEQVTEEWLVRHRATRGQAETLLEANAWHLFFAEELSGNGMCMELFLSPDEAIHFEAGERVAFHFKRDRIPGFGSLAFVEREPKAPALAM
jgi:hypothetical protein